MPSRCRSRLDRRTPAIILLLAACYDQSTSRKTPSCAGAGLRRSCASRPVRPKWDLAMGLLSGYRL